MTPQTPALDIQGAHDLALTAQELHEIRNLLPYGWRQKVQRAHPGLSTRQITETFAHRTRNATHADWVFSLIALHMDQLGRPDLATKCRNRIAFCMKAKELPTAA